MNKQRRLMLKVIGASGFFAAGYGTCFYLQSNTSPSLDSKTWSQQLIISSIFEPLKERFPDAANTINSHLGFTGKTDEEFLEQVEKRIQQDYKEGLLVAVDDWQISQTEVMVLVAALELGVAVVAPEGEKHFENAPFEEFLKVTSWGPQQTYQGVKFNEQPDGHCGMWINADNIDDGLVVYIGGKETHAFINESGLTTGIYTDVEAFINKIGDSDIVIYDAINHRKQKIGTFQVLPPFEFYRYKNGTRSQVFGVLNNWGPQNAKVGEVFNEQANGMAAFWIKISSRSTQIRLAFNGHDYKATVRKDIITSSFTAKNLPSKPGTYPVHLISAEYNEKLHVGDVKIEQNIE